MANETLETVNLISEAVECIPEDSASLQIFIKDVDTKTITLEVESNCTIQKIKHLINKKKNIAVEQQMIIYKGKELQNELNLSHYDIKNNSVLHLVNNQPLNESFDIVEEEKQPTTLDANPLITILKEHDLYYDLYSILNENGIDLGILKHDLRENDIDALCDELGINMTQKLKFRKLTRIIHKQNNPDSKMAVVLIGDMDAGKTCLMRKYAKDTYGDCTSTIGVDKIQKVETLDDDSSIKITIWDTAGQERFHSICRTYYRRADCMIICYDASKKTPFESCEKWRKEIDNYGGDDVIVLMVGCKSDKSNDMSLIAKAESIIEQPEWQKFSTVHCQCSAKTGNNVRKVFLTASDLVLRNRTKNKGNHDVIDQLQKEQEQQRTCC